MRVSSWTALRSRPAVALGLLCFVHVILAMDFTVVYVALPAIGSDIGLDETALVYTTATYSLVFAAFLISSGRAADTYGKRRVLVVGLLLFAVASVIAILGSVGALLAGRALQGLAAAIVTPPAQALVTGLYPEGRQRVRALSFWGMAGAAGLALGGPVGGGLTAAFGWKSIMLINVPIGVFGVLLVLASVGADPSLTRVRGPSVVLPMVVVTAGLALLVWAFAEASLSSPVTTGLRGISAAALLALFVILERRSSSPVIPRSVLAQRTIVSADVATLLFGALFGGQFFLMTLYLQTVRDLPTLLAGLMFVPVTLFIVVGNLVGGASAARIGPTRTFVTGLALFLVGNVVLVVVPTDAAIGTLLPALVLVGLGTGLAFVSVTIAATSTAGSADHGIASSLFNVALNVGQSIGPAVLIAVATAPGWASAGSGLRAGYVALAALTLVSIAVAILLGGRRITSAAGDRSTLPAR